MVQSLMNTTSQLVHVISDTSLPTGYVGEPLGTSGHIELMIAHCHDIPGGCSGGSAMFVQVESVPDALLALT